MGGRFGLDRKETIGWAVGAGFRLLDFKVDSARALRDDASIAGMVSVAVIVVVERNGGSECSCQQREQRQGRNAVRHHPAPNLNPRVSRTDQVPQPLKPATPVFDSAHVATCGRCWVPQGLDYAADIRCPHSWKIYTPDPLLLDRYFHLDRDGGTDGTSPQGSG